MIANLGINAVRRESEHTDVAVGLRMDTGGSYATSGAKGYFAGIGGEYAYDDAGQLKSFGISLMLVKWNVKMQA